MLDFDKVNAVCMEEELKIPIEDIKHACSFSGDELDRWAAKAVMKSTPWDDMARFNHLKHGLGELQVKALIRLLARRYYMKVPIDPVIKIPEA